AVLDMQIDDQRSIVIEQHQPILDYEIAKLLSTVKRPNGARDLERARAGLDQIKVGLTIACQSAGQQQGAPQDVDFRRVGRNNRKEGERSLDGVGVRVAGDVANELDGQTEDIVVAAFDVDVFEKYTA